jgi:hypothetical protein
MRRTWLLIIALALFAMPRAAFAFHAGITFTEPPASGGGGGLLYLGTKAERGWNCSVCHTDAPGNVQVKLTSEPPELMRDFRYQPDTRYEITVQMVIAGGETRGTQNPIANYNGIGLTFLDAVGEPLGKPSGPADEFQEINFTTLFSLGTNAGETKWSFSWTSPAEAGHGTATLHLAVVDGNGGGASGEAFTDPFGDDLLVTKIALAEAGGEEARVDAGAQSMRTARARPARGGPAAMFACLMFGLVVMAHRRR